MFIYVMDMESRDKLLDRGYKLVKANERNDMWIFSLPDHLQFSADLDDVPHVVSNRLTF